MPPSPTDDPAGADAEARMPLISVIVPVFDVEDQVAACIASLRAQVGVRMEVIVVDDGSTDASRVRAEAAMAGDERFRLIAQENRGLSGARNTGLDAARGELVAFVDSDDRVVPDFLWQMARALDELDADWVACAIRFVGTAPDVPGHGVTHSAVHGAPALAAHPGPHRWPLDDWREVARHFPSAWNKLYRRSLIEGLRFDEGTWFEDHGFYWRAAARTDHIAHLPQPLYLQTRGRAGQITGRDDERVFEQFAVLDGLRAVIEGRDGADGAADVSRAKQSGRTGGPEAFERIAGRLLFERTTSLRDPERRARFAAHAAAWLEARGLAYAPGWDAAIGRSFALELAGRLPLSVVIPWAARGPEDAGLLEDSLAALARQHGPGREVLVVCDDEAAAEAARAVTRAHPEARVLVQPAPGPGPARDHGIAQARGDWVMALDAGDRPAPGALQEICDALLESGAEMAVTAMRDGDGGPHLAGFHDAGAPDPGRAAAKLLAPGPGLALSLDAHPSAKVFRRDLLQGHDIRFGAAPGGERALVLRAALAATACVHLPWPAVEISDAPGARRLRAAPPDARRLARGHDAMVAALSAEEAARLPRGWQRRLFARALEAMLADAGPLSLAALGRFLARIELSVLRRGLGGAETGPGGLDHDLSPRVRQAMDPGGLLAQAAGRPRRLASTLRDGSRPRPADPAGLRAFPAAAGARLYCEVSLAEADFANLGFLDAAGAGLLLHVSLQLRRGAIVLNARPGGAWGVPRVREVALSRDAVHRLEVEIAPPRVEIRLDGGIVARFGTGRLPAPDDFPGLARIARVDQHGGVLPGSVRIARAGPGKAAAPGPALSGPALRLDEGFVLRARVAPGTEAALAAEGSEGPPPPLVARPRADHTDLSAALPGRLWRGLAPDAPLRLRLEAQGASLARLEIDRDAMAGRVTHALLEGNLADDPATATLVVEHVRFARLQPRLAPDARAALARLAEHYGLGAFLAGDDAPAAGAAPARAAPAEAPEGPGGPAAPADPDPRAPDGGPPALPLPEDGDRDAAEAAMARLAQALHAGPDLDPLALVRDLALPPRARRMLFLALSEVFAVRGFDLAGLAAMARAEGLDDFAPGDDPWSNGAMMPFLLERGEAAQVRRAMWSLIPLTPRWIVTAPVGWSVRRLLARDDVPEALRDGILAAFFDFVERRAVDYWERTCCTALVETAAALVCATDRMGPAMAARTLRFALHAYGLDRGFWDRLAEAEARGRTIPAGLAGARAAMDEICAACDGLGAAPPEGVSPLDAAAARRVARALQVFEAAGTAAAPRLRRELLGPAEVALAPGAAPDAAALTATGRPAGPPLLRHMARPGAAEVGAEMAAMAAGALPALYDTVERAPHHPVQKRLGRALRAVLARDRPPTAEEIAALLPDLGLLAGPASRFLGQGLALRLLAQLARAGVGPDDAAARPLLAALARWQARAAADPEARPPQPPSPRAAGAVAVRMALRALGRAGGPLAAAACARLDVPPPAPGTLPPEDEAPSPLFDAIVVVFSCRAYLETRIPALRDGWTGGLAALGIPHVIVVGGGDGRREGNVVHLDAPDDYEGLPQKTLAAIAWVAAHSSAAHMVKVDDDCFLDAAEFFEGLSYAKADYHGRVLSRVPGQLDRTWHMAKSASPRGRLELDRSPEPSAYADGGSGYALSRTAMEAALDAAASPEGRELIQSSFMEDKMLGDLLALRGIAVSGEDHRVTVRRRTHPQAIPVPSWVNGFDASRAAPVSLVHLDTHLEQAAARDRLASPALTPKKLWPSYQEMRLGYGSNALELVSDAARVEAAVRAPVAVVACMRNEMFMLPRFLSHYRALGVEAFLVADNLSDDGTLEHLAAQPDVAVFSVDTDYKASRYGVAWQQALLANLRLGRWSLVADADELLVWEARPGGRLPDLVAGPGFEGAEAARVFMLDMYPRGPLSEADFRAASPFAQAGFTEARPFRTDTPLMGPFSDRPTWTSGLRHRLIPGSRPTLFVAQKYALLRYMPFMRLSAGLHYMAGARLAPRELVFAHFKYNADFRRKAQAEVARRQHFNDAEEYRAYLALASEGRDVIYDPEQSVPWTDSAFVRKRLG